MSSRPSVAVLLLLVVACAAPGQRAEYAPVGQQADDSLALWVEETRLMAVAVRCQGRYLNEVDGERVATLHVQLLVTRTDSRPMALPLDELRLTLERPDGELLELGPAEVWAGQERLRERFSVPAWSRRVADVFFDEPDDDGRAPVVLRLRFVHVEGADDGGDGRRVHHECQFFLLDADDPRRGASHVVDDASFGYRDGYYFPGLGELGTRGLVPTDEARLFYVFHAP